MDREKLGMMKLSRAAKAVVVCVAAKVFRQLRRRRIEQMSPKYNQRFGAQIRSHVTGPLRDGLEELPPE